MIEMMTKEKLYWGISGDSVDMLTKGKESVRGNCPRFYHGVT